MNVRGDCNFNVLIVDEKINYCFFFITFTLKLLPPTSPQFSWHHCLLVIINIGYKEKLPLIFSLFSLSFFAEVFKKMEK